MLRILVSLYLLGTILSYGDSTLQKCDNALAACQVVVHEQDQAIVHLKQQVKDTTDKLVEAERAPLIPTWAWVTIGVVIGGAVGYSIHK